jgi:hypothetical protein
MTGWTPEKAAVCVAALVLVLALLLWFGVI